MSRPGLFCCLLLGGTALAQQSVVEHCRNTSSDADRIACLEAALLEKEATAPQPAGIGAEQVAARNQSRDDIRNALAEARGLVVASYEIVPYERLLVTLENGQVWRQIKGDTQTVRVDLDKNQTVDISESTLGGYKLRLNEMRRTIRVERVQ